METEPSPRDTIKQTRLDHPANYDHREQEEVE